MIRAAALFLALPLLSLSASAAPRFATVRIADIYRNLESTKTMTEDLDRQRKAIGDDERAIHLRKIIKEMEELYKELQGKRGEQIDEATRKLAQSFEQKRQESQTLQQEFQLFEAEKKKEINRQMVVGMREKLSKISDTARKISTEQGLEGTFDISGNSNTGVPILLYVKNGKDITEDVVAALKDSGEPSAQPASAETAPQAPAKAPAETAPASE